MNSIESLRAQRNAIDLSIAEQKRLAVQQVRDLMVVLGVTVEDLGGKMPSDRPVRFRDERGNTWVGVGKRPRWLQDRVRDGATVEQFRVRG